MREALGLTLYDSPETAIKRYYTLYKLLNQAEIKTIKISKEEKKGKKEAIFIRINLAFFNGFLEVKTYPIL